MIIINIVLIFFLYQNRGCNKKLDMVAFLDVGQGDAIYVENKHGQNILIDTGNKDMGVLKQIKKVRYCNNIHIQNLILTHPDQDHIGDATNLINKNLVDKVIHNGFLDMNQQSESVTENDLEQIIKDRQILTQDMVLNPVLDFKDFDLHFLFPYEKPYQDKKGKGKSVDDNDYSIVLKLSYASTSFMLTGDAPMRVERQIIDKYCENKKVNISCPTLESTVLKFGHHGSKNSSSQEWLDKVKAVDYIVSAGLNNKYNHPNEEVLNKINKKTSRIRETFLEGNIVYVMD